LGDHYRDNKGRKESLCKPNHRGNSRMKVKNFVEILRRDAGQKDQRSSNQRSSRRTHRFWRALEINKVTLLDHHWNPGELAYQGKDDSIRASSEKVAQNAKSDQPGVQRKREPVKNHETISHESSVREGGMYAGKRSAKSIDARLRSVEAKSV